MFSTFTFVNAACLSLMPLACSVTCSRAALGMPQAKTGYGAAVVSDGTNSYMVTRSGHRGPSLASGWGCIATVVGAFWVWARFDYCACGLDVLAAN